MKICSILTATWYPGALGSTDDPWVILTAGDLVESDSPFGGSMEQVVQRADFIRADQPDHWSRGNQTSTLEFTRYFLLDPPDALEAGIAHAASLPEQTGWLHLEVAGKSATWSMDQVVFESLPWSIGRGSKKDTTGLTYRFRAGELVQHSGAVPDPPGSYLDGEILIDPPDPTDRGALLLEEA